MVLASGTDPSLSLVVSYSYKSVVERCANEWVQRGKRMTPLEERERGRGRRSVYPRGKGYSRADVRYFSLLPLPIIYSLPPSFNLQPSTRL